MPRTKPSPILLVCSCDLDVGNIPALVGSRLVEEHYLAPESLARISDMPEVAKHLKHRQKVVAVDGCPSECALKALGSCGIECARHLDLGSLGLSRGHSPAVPEIVGKVAEVAKMYLG